MTLLWQITVLTVTIVVAVVVIMIVSRLNTMLRGKWLCSLGFFLPFFYFCPTLLPFIKWCLRSWWAMLLNCAASVHMPRIGHSTPGFNWYGTERLIRKHLSSQRIPTYVYPSFVRILLHWLFQPFPVLHCVFGILNYQQFILKPTNRANFCHI